VRKQEAGTRRRASAVRQRLSYANVVATMALVVAVGTGGAYAAQKIGPKDIKKNAVRAKHINKNQVRAKQIRQNAVRTKHVKDGAVTEAKLAEPATRRFAAVSASGDVAYGEGAVDANRDSDGRYTVTFDRSIVNCVAVGNAGFGNPNPGGTVNSSATVTVNLDHGDDDQIEVMTFNSGVLPTPVFADNSFLIAVFC